MSVTSYRPSNRAWLHRLLSGRPHQIIGGADDPYLLRWYLIPRNPVLNVYLHKFMRSDDDRALHDHPWWFVSLMLRGQYDEITDAGLRRRSAGSIAFRRAEWRHRVQLLQSDEYYRRTAHVLTHGLPLSLLPDRDEQPCWTLIVTGRRSRTWGFWCKARGDAINHAYRALGIPNPGDRFIPWQEFGDAGCGETA